MWAFADVDFASLLIDVALLNKLPHFLEAGCVDSFCFSRYRRVLAHCAQQHRGLEPGIELLPCPLAVLGDGPLELFHNFSASLQGLALVFELVREPLIEPRAYVLPFWGRAL